MSKFFYPVIFILTVLSLYGCPDSTPPPVPTTQVTTTPPVIAKVLISPNPGTVGQGSTFTRTVEVQNVGSTFYAAFDVTYDPSVVEYVEATEGGFLSRNGADQTSFQAALQDNVQGKVAVGVTRIGQIGEVSGTGVLLTLSFKAVGPGTTSLAFANPKEIKNSMNQNAVIDAWENGTVIVQ